MKRFVGLLAIFVTLAACGAAAMAQQPKKVFRIGYLSSTDPATESIRAEAIRLALRALGNIDGQNVAIEYRYAEGKQDRSRQDSKRSQACRSPRRAADEV
jgi:putative ABC transport system substrate-binding protein